MSASLGSQFYYQIAFGCLLAMVFVPRAPVGALFYRIMGSSILLLLVAGLGLYLSRGGSWRAPVALPVLAAVLTYPIYSGPVRGWWWGVAVTVAMLASASGVFASVHANMVRPDALPVALGGLSALATGAVAGSVGLAMVLGHWYLTVPNLGIQHLKRLNRVTIGSMLASLLLVGISCIVFGDELNAKSPPLLGPWGLFYLGTRVTVGLLVPLLFAWMTASSLRYQNTRSATGILYASTVLVLIGAAASVSLQDSYGLPL